MTTGRQRPTRVGLISLGCAKNLVDSEIMLGALLKSGLEITPEASAADVVIVNTCSFIDAAQKESVEAILESDQLRAERHPDQGLIVAGCLPQRFREDLPKLLPEVDAFMGIDQVAQVSEIVEKALAARREKTKLARPGPRGKSHVKTISKKLAQVDAARPAPPEPVFEVNARPTYIPDYATPRFRLTPKHFAYVKIAEGCNHPCSFCIIPRMRGAHRSRGQADIVAEARQLLAAGVKELNLISQDSTYYGLDLRPNHSRAISSPEKFTAAARALPAEATTLCTLLRELNALPGDFWIRLLYTHPAHWSDELIATIAACPKVARYVDMPLQHIHRDMLERMRRETSSKHIIDLIARIRAGIPGIALRTTFIVGFPGETDEHFDALLKFINDTRFERLGVFTYSAQEGTRAGKMESQLDDRVKKHRQKKAMGAQLKIAREISASFVGRELKVLIESKAGPEELRAANLSSWEHGLIRSAPAAAAKSPLAVRHREFLIARGEGDAPDIDGRVYILGQAPLGQFARVRVLGHTDYDLIGEVIRG